MDDNFQTGTDVAAAILVQAFFNVNTALFDKNLTAEQAAEKARPFFLAFRKMIEDAGARK